MPTIDFPSIMTPVGQGVAVDKNGHIFSSISAFTNPGAVTPSTPANCATRCSQLVSQYSLADYIGCQSIERIKNGVSEHECMCIFGNGQLPSVPSSYKPTQNLGVGHITSTDPSQVTCPNPQFDSCHASTFALNSATASPSIRPSTSPSTSPSFSPSTAAPVTSVSHWVKIFFS